MRYPDIYLVGAPKCGTTSLQYYLGQQPDIFVPEFKEPHYHTVQLTELPKWGVKKESEYLDLYQNAIPNQRLIDASAWNLYIPEAAQAIYETSPNAHIIISLRHPVKRAYSHFMHMLQRGWEKYYSFEEVIKHEQKRIQSGEFWDVHYFSTGFYAQQVKRYYDLFPKDKIKVLIFEEWSQNPEKYIQEICEFLDLNNSVKLQSQEAKNISQISQAQILRIRLQKYQYLKRIMRSLIPNSLKNNVMVTLNKKKVKELPKLNQEKLEHFSQVFVEDIKTLESILGYSIKSWI